MSVNPVLIESGMMKSSKVITNFTAKAEAAYLNRKLYSIILVHIYRHRHDGINDTYILNEMN